MNNLDRFFLNGTQGFAEMMPSTGYGPIMGRTHKGELTQPVVTHQTVRWMKCLRSFSRVSNLLCL